jgi:hypothetical protein
MDKDTITRRTMIKAGAVPGLMALVASARADDKDQEKAKGDQGLVRQADIAGLRLEPVNLNESPAAQNQLDDMQLIVVDPTPTLANAALGSGHSIINPADRPLAATAWMERVFNRFTMSCICGTSYANNCAHYLSNAMALEGVTFPAGLAKCPRGRLIRAKELLGWFRPFATGFRPNCSGITSGYWFVYQEYNGQGHVCIHYHLPSGYLWRGTTDLPSWPIQWHYFY